MATETPSLTHYVGEVLDELRYTMVTRNAAYSDFRDNAAIVVGILREMDIVDGASRHPDWAVAALTYIGGKLSRLLSAGNGKVMHRDS